MILDDTIAAISTAPGTGAIAIVRLSGNNSFQIASQLFSLDKEKRIAPDQLISHLSMHGYIYDTDPGLIIDEVILIPYKAPRTYTGEDLIEINCHGGAMVTREILDLCLSSGARLARRGEFTERAFINGRIDLTQAEAVYDLIQAKTVRQRRYSSSVLSGHLGKRIKKIRDDLLDLMAAIVAGIDFPEEVGDLPEDKIAPRITDAIKTLAQLAQTTKSGQFLRDGLRLTIIGKPNVGKSSLLNQLLKFERAIVTDQPGTTRDSLAEVLDINGIPVILTDTAGIRDSDDRIEKLGMERSRLALEQCDLVLFVTDAAAEFDQDDFMAMKLIADHACISISNKIDLLPDFNSKQSVALAHFNNGSTAEKILTADHFVTVSTEAGTNVVDSLFISAKTGIGIDRLTAAIERFAVPDPKFEDAGGSLNARQGELCNKSIEALTIALETLSTGLPQDCLASDLKSAIDKLSEVCGEAVSEEIIANVFANFCIGK